ncbi:hypothetical protein DL767_001497 [Monosporascus sp. MG133]|nr:hypothetical protein DL767_001497 [Monosporascus sp. MG133]
MSIDATESLKERYRPNLMSTGCQSRIASVPWIGLMQVKETLQQHLGIKLTIVDTTELFLGRLADVVEPEAKRKIIGETFIDLSRKRRSESRKKQGTPLLLARWNGFFRALSMPTLIESLSYRGPSATIKSHHNVGCLPARMMNGQAQLKLIEPFRALFKDEVRAFGRQLGIHGDLAMRHPFPGPGIGIR